MGRFCSNCGAQFPENVQFCGFCGQALAPTQPAVQYVQQPSPQIPPQQYTPLQAQQTYQPQYAQQPQTAMLTEKQRVLANAPASLNRSERPWTVTLEGDSIVARWKWMDATFFAPHEINDETKQFTFTVTLSDNRTWKELDKTENKSSGVKMNGGKLSFGGSSSTFIGKTNQKSIQFGAGRDNRTGQVGLVGFKFNTTDVKQPIRDYLTACGWKKSGMFG